MTREEHIEWAKKRALAYLDNGFKSDVTSAIASIASDLSKHKETRDHIGISVMVELRMSGLMNSVQEARDFIEGF